MRKLTILICGIFLTMTLYSEETINLLYQLPNGSEFEVFQKDIEINVTDAEKKIIYYILQNITELNRHRMRGEEGNTVYYKENDGAEVVFDKDGNLVTNSYNKGSYNYYIATEDPIKHFLYDSLPHLALGNAREDPTSILERTFYFSLDLDRAIQIYIFNHDDFLELEIDSDFTEAEEKIFAYFWYLLFNPSLELNLADKNEITKLKKDGDYYYRYYYGVQKILNVYQGD